MWKLSDTCKWLTNTLTDYYRPSLLLWLRFIRYFCCQQNTWNVQMSEIFLGKSAISPIATALSFSLFVSVCYFHLHRSYFVKIKNVKNDVDIFLYLPSNGAIAEVLLHDLDLFQSQLSNVNISETMKDSWKCIIRLFGYWYLLSNGAIMRMLYSMTLTYFCQIFEMLLFWQFCLDLIYMIHWCCVILVYRYVTVEIYIV